MSVFTYNVIRSCNYGTVHKFIVVRVLFYEAKMEMRFKKTSVRASHDSIDDISGNGFIGNPFYYLLIFIQNLIAYTYKYLPSRKACHAGR